MRSAWLVLFLLCAATAVWGSGDGGAIGHVADAQELEVPFTTVDANGHAHFPGVIHLPTFHPFGREFPVTRHMIMISLSAVLLIVVFAVARRRSGLVPKGLYNALESLVVFIRDEVVISSIGEKHGPKYVPYLLTVFFFVLTLNFIGLVPFGATATANINVTFSMAMCTLLLMIATGIRTHGFFGFFKNLVPHGVPTALFPLMFVVELMGLLAKPFALMVRLFANMLAGHMVILSLLGLIFTFAASYGTAVGLAVAPVSVAFSLFVYLLEILVALIQAYIFTFLTALFIGMMIHAH